MFLMSEMPFEDPLRNKMEIFNEVILLTMIFVTFCFTDVMEPEAQVTIGLFLIILIGIYILVHLISILSDSVKKICLLIWL